MSGGWSDRTHGLNHAPLPDGVLLSPGFCAGCDSARGPVDRREAVAEAIHKAWGQRCPWYAESEPLREWFLGIADAALSEADREGWKP